MKQVLILASLLFAQCAVVADFRWLNSWDKNYPAMPIVIDPYIKEVEAADRKSTRLNSSHG